MKILLIITFSLLSVTYNSQDLDYNLLNVTENGDNIYGKRENYTDIWIKTVSKTKRFKDKNGKITTIKGKENIELYNCDCNENTIKLINNNNKLIKATPFSNEQLIIDYTCSNLEYKKLIGEIDEFTYYLGNTRKVGNFYDVWYKTIEKESIENYSGIKFIHKVRLDCKGKKWGNIIEFIYNEDNKLNDFFEISYDRVNGMRRIDDDELMNMIYKDICIENQ